MKQFDFQFREYLLSSIEPNHRVQLGLISACVAGTAAAVKVPAARSYTLFKAQHHALLQVWPIILQRRQITKYLTYTLTRHRGMHVISKALLCLRAVYYCSKHHSTFTPDCTS
jgi:hypothetical protein